MTTFIRQTLELIQVALHYPLSVAIRGKVKARQLRAIEIDRILGIR